MTDILLIDSDTQHAEALAAELCEQGLQVSAQAQLPEQTSLSQHPCVVVLDEIVEPYLSDFASSVPTIVLTRSGSIPAAVSFIKRGAADYLSLPLDTAQILAAIERATTNPMVVARPQPADFPMIGSSPAMQQLKANIAKAGPTDSTVLILGQSGTGKELVARALHAASARAAAPLISINCATIPHNLIEAELFGLEQFESGAHAHRGLIETAEGGTLFLDEVAELPPAAQARLLRVLKGENRRVGSTATEPTNVRIIAATHRNLSDLTEQGQFRQDLFYRLNVVSFEIVPLNQRKEDIHEIAVWLLERTSKRLNKTGLSFAQEALQVLVDYHWPGNVRELENALERAVILADNNSEITQALLAIQPVSKPAPTTVDAAADPDQTSLEDYFVRFVTDNQDNFTETELAEKLGISRKSLWERRQRLNIPRRRTRKRGPRRDTTAT
ncbi:MAG: sigma-54-dependent transcriptional regulator [bacterium]